MYTDKIILEHADELELLLDNCDAQCQSCPCSLQIYAPGDRIYYICCVEDMI